ncbi:MAG: iron-containing alcohol dehydrogenase [Lachnospiraceae bacterium]
MQNFTQYNPTEIIFGKNTENESGKAVKKWGGSRVLLVYGQGSAVKSGLVERVKKILLEEGIACAEIGGVQPNPRLKLAEEGVEKALEFGADFILAIGGGSVIDTAKAIAHGTANPGVKLWDIWTGKVTLTKTTLTGSILTISAAGSETSDSAVITNEELGKKAGLNTSLNRPVFAIMNPELTYTLPQYQVACGVVDIMMHTLERYFLPNQSNEMTDEIAEGLLHTTINNGTVAYETPTDYHAMSELMWCGSLSHNGITGLGRPRDFCVHKFGHALGAKFDKTHGATLSATWGAWANYVYQNDPARFKHYGERVWNLTIDNEEEAALAAIESTVNYFKSLNMPVNLPELLGEAPTDEVLWELSLDATMNNTVRLSIIKELDANDVFAIYKAANMTAATSSVVSSTGDTPPGDDPKSV